VTHRKQQKS